VETLRVGDSVSCFTVLPETGGILAADDHGGLYLVGAAAAATTGGATVGGSSSSQSTSASKSAVAVTSAASSSRKLVRKLVADENNSMNSNYSTNSGVASHHFGMVTSLSAKIFKGSASAAAYSRTSTGLLRGSGGLVLSTGVDWTTKLWAPAYGGPAASSAAPASTSNQRQEVSPLWSATSHSYDYMSDVKWSPVHPGLFATACSNGTLGLWNLASSLDEPLTGAAGLSLMGDSSDATIAAAAESSTAGAKQNRGLNKIRWSGDGRRLAVASGDVLHVLTVQEDVARPKGDEDDKIMNQLVSRGLITRQ
jgi:dynein intermediate chain